MLSSWVEATNTITCQHARQTLCDVWRPWCDTLPSLLEHRSSLHRRLWCMERHPVVIVSVWLNVRLKKISSALWALKKMFKLGVCFWKIYSDIQFTVHISRNRIHLHFTVFPSAFQRRHGAATFSLRIPVHRRCRLAGSSHRVPGEHRARYCSTAGTASGRPC